MPRSPHKRPTASLKDSFIDHFGTKSVVHDYVPWMIFEHIHSKKGYQDVVPNNTPLFIHNADTITITIVRKADVCPGIQTFVAKSFGNYGLGRISCAFIKPWKYFA